MEILMSKTLMRFLSELKSGWMYIFRHIEGEPLWCPFCKRAFSRYEWRHHIEMGDISEEDKDARGYLQIGDTMKLMCPQCAMAK